MLPTIGGYELHSIPIKTMDNYVTFITLVDEAILASEKSDYTILSLKMKEIDRIVYDMYGLTEDEIKIIEESV